MKRVAFYTLGCKVNQYETNGMIQKFQEVGYEIVDFEDVADIYIVNTCTVTSISDKKSRMFLRQAKRKNPESIVVACGCYVQVAKEEIEKIPEITLCIGTNEKVDIIDYIEKYLNTKSEEIEISDVFKQKEYSDFGLVTYTEKTRAVIKVQDGCDRFCSYCLIPYARGRVRSRKPQNVINEIKKIAEEGIKEVVITGIHVASYGKDFNNDYKLIDLLEEINNINGIERIRLGSIEPLLISEEFIERLKKLNKICHHFHLSLQSGAKATLERMNRRYSPEEFNTIVKRLRMAYEDVILTTDIIVGFPGETDEEFNETYEFLKQIDFYQMHVFKYSPRKGTKAAVMKNQVLGEIKDYRSDLLLELSNNNQNEYLKKYIGKKVKVLFEEREEEYYKGHTQNYIMVNVKSEKNIENQILEVEIESVGKNGLQAKVIKM
ncbi:MAG: tRNA (N(6)-L-threonylcarbamoyladenosine(37)-C(2))-methylthiotransferase MtaB [Clostridia bacterium]|nr:tRNA (N(6)-L-threonylcarbamoyladenosine(37)-C(2))-methylthiotransferase MtaB [Clostridia bacterium]